MSLKKNKLLQYIFEDSEKKYNVRIGKLGTSLDKRDA
jgi:hypothetical protein